MDLEFTGGMVFTVKYVDTGGAEGRSVCAGGISGDPAGVSYLFPAVFGNDHVFVSFVVHRTRSTGSFALGDYPDASKNAPAAVNVVYRREGGPGEGFAAWNSGSGALVVDVGGRSGSVIATLPFAGWRKLPQEAASPAPTTSLGELQLKGTWVCPDGN